MQLSSLCLANAQDVQMAKLAMKRQEMQMQMRVRRAITDLLQIVGLFCVGMSLEPRCDAGKVQHHR